MAYVKVHVENKLGGKTVLGMDDERDAERIEYLKKLVKREDLESVTVVAADEKKTAAKKSAASSGG